MSDVSREEFTMLRDQVAEQARKLEAIDQGGTRGVGILAVQIQRLTGDFARHEGQHDRDTARRRADGWRLLALVVGLVGPLYPVLLLTHH